MATVNRTRDQHSAQGAVAAGATLTLTAPNGHSASLWRTENGWHVEASSARLQERVSEALRQPVRVARSETDADGARVLIGWADVGPMDPRYLAHWTLQLSRLRLEDVTVEDDRVSPRSRRAP